MKKSLLYMLLGIVILAGLTIAMVDVPENITLPGGKKGAVEFTHKAHVDMGQTCKECHHTLAGDNDMPDKKCRDCHTSDSDVKLMKAFHGNCVDCHKDANKNDGKAAPAKCSECHKK